MYQNGFGDANLFSVLSMEKTIFLQGSIKSHTIHIVLKHCGSIRMNFVDSNLISIQYRWYNYILSKNQQFILYIALCCTQCIKLKMYTDSTDIAISGY
jgi:hypothetical protein